MPTIELVTGNVALNMKAISQQRDGRNERFFDTHWAYLIHQLVFVQDEFAFFDIGLRE